MEVCQRPCHCVRCEQDKQANRQARAHASGSARSSQGPGTSADTDEGWTQSVVAVARTMHAHVRPAAANIIEGVVVRGVAFRGAILVAAGTVTS